MKQSHDFPKPGLCHVKKFLSLSDIKQIKCSRIFWQNRQKSVAKKVSKPQSAKKRVHRKKSNYDTLSFVYYVGEN